MGDTPSPPISLSSIHVRWSPTSAAYIAWSDQDPSLTYSDPFSSLAAVDGLIAAATAPTSNTLVNTHRTNHGDAR
ncbi:hypothetical protein [Nocardia yamanashiensis]|uniref:hypothetical protein n=1 Tax=Nocardia yamanashiensis TaxID=209247 RepID=UPI000AD5EEDF|nr:hypothetical protein [Nocardia yamanashiensis]